MQKCRNAETARVFQGTIRERRVKIRNMGSKRVERRSGADGTSLTGECARMGRGGGDVAVTCRSRGGTPPLSPLENRRRGGLACHIGRSVSRGGLCQGVVGRNSSVLEYKWLKKSLAPV